MSERQVSRVEREHRGPPRGRYDDTRGRVMADHFYEDGWTTALAREGRLPARYQETWATEFDEFVQPSLRPGMKILDVGAGRSPTIPPDRRPPETSYVGLDVSEAELRQAPPRSYDELRVADIGRRLGPADPCFDLVVSWQVLEHVRSLETALENLRSCLRPGGRMFALLSGRYSVFAFLNRMVPHRLARTAMKSLLRRPIESVFPAYYDRCSSSAMNELMTAWSGVQVTPKYSGACYFGFSPTLMQAYVMQESWVASRGWSRLATHYLVCAVR